LRVDEVGVVRVGASRVTLDTLIGSYRYGNTAEEIVQQFPSLSLAEVHAAIAYYLTHVTEVEAYLHERERDAAEAFGGDEDKAARYARLSALLEEWTNDESGFDERVEPVIDRALKDSAPRHSRKS